MVRALLSLLHWLAVIVSFYGGSAPNPPTSPKEQKKEKRDSAGEGIDLAGDILSSLIVVRLPFPVPDPVLEYEKSLYSDFYSYLNEIIVSEMLTQTRQWIGRGRRETDTCVFTILDSRANGHYKNDILAALPDMPVTDQLSDVGRFLLSRKNGSYFE